MDVCLYSSGNAGICFECAESGKACDGRSRYEEIKKRTSMKLVLSETGAAGRNRTHDPLVRSQVLYPAELQPRKI